MAAYKPEHIVPSHGNPTTLAKANKDSYEYLKFFENLLLILLMTMVIFLISAKLIRPRINIYLIMIRCQEEMHSRCIPRWSLNNYQYTPQLLVFFICPLIFLLSVYDRDAAIHYLQNINVFFMSRLKALFLTIIIIQIASSAKSFADEELRVSVGNWPPYYIYHDESESTGIVLDVLSEVKKRLDVDFIMIKLPQKRMLTYFRTGEMDIEPTSNPVWRSVDKDISLYSIPYLQIQKVISVKKSTKISGNYLQDFKGKTIGTVLGYNHDLTIGKAFKDKLIIRKDSQRHDTNLKLLKADRIDGIIAERRTLQYWINEINHNSEDYKEAYKVGTPIDISMRLHKSQANLLPQLNQTLKEMLEEGFVDKAITKYTSKSKDY